MLMRITWRSQGFYRLNIPILPLCEKTVILNCEAKRSNPLPLSGDRPKNLIQGKLRKVISDQKFSDSTHEVLKSASSLQATAPDQACLPNRQQSLPELEILEIIKPPKVFDVGAALQWIRKKALSAGVLSLRALRSEAEQSPSVPMLCDRSNLHARATKQPHGVSNIAKEANFNIINTIIKGTAVSFAVFFFSFFAMNYEAYWDIARHSWAENIQPKVMQASSLFFAGNNDEEIMQIAVIKDVAKAEKPLSSILNPKTQVEEVAVNDLKPAAITPPDHRIIIPKIGKNVPIVESKADNLYSRNWEELEKELSADLKKGVVHYPGTAFPGQKGNVFLTGHSSYYPWDDGEYKDVFALLGKLEVGDEIVLFYKQKEYRYKVSDIRQVKPNNVDILKQTDDNRLTLMTCTPVGTTLRRLVITALQV